MRNAAEKLARRQYRVRFRFRVSKTLHVEECELTFQVGVREVKLSSAQPDFPIKDSGWLVANARGFETEEEARRFGHALRAAFAVASVANRLGVDGGVDLTTGGLAELIKEHLKEAQGILVRDNVHGVDVFLDDPNVRIFSMQANATVSKNPQPFLGDVSDFMGKADQLTQRAQDIVLLLNYALMRPEPVAQIVFSISAVEMLGQTETWSEDQRKLIADLSTAAEASTRCSNEERDEVVSALRNGLHKLSLRQGVMRLLGLLGLSSLKGEWDKLYAERCTLVHGLAPRPGADYSQLAHEIVSLCGRILLTAIAQELSGADRHIDRVYPRITQKAMLS